MQDDYQALGVDPKATTDEIEAAFAEALAVRRTRRAKTSDLHVARSILTETPLRRAYDAARIGVAATDKMVLVKDKAIEVAGQVKGLVPEVDAKELASEAWHLTLRTTVFASGLSAKAAYAAGAAARKVQVAAAQALQRFDK